MHDGCRSCTSILVALGVHVRIIMAILRHSKIALTMEVYSLVPDVQTRDALRQLGEELGWETDDDTDGLAA